MNNLNEALTFDDVLIVPSKSSVKPSSTELKTLLTKKINLNIPLVSAAMDTVTESSLAIKIAQMGGLGFVHKNMSLKDQANQVLRVKRFESGMVVDPFTINPDSTLMDAIKLKDKYNISGIPVVENSSKKLVGILTNRDIRFASNLQQSVKSLMTKDNLITVRKNISMENAKKLLHKHRIEKLLVVDRKYRCIGLITVKDIDKAKNFPLATKDSFGRLMVGGAVGVGEEQGIERTRFLKQAGVDIIVIDTAHGHSKNVIDTLKKIKKIYPDLPVVVGNIATSDAAKDLIKSGADALKVGIGPGSICTTRIVAGVGVPQLHAISEVFNTAKKNKIPIISDGGIKFSGDISKAIGFGANTVMIGSLFAGTEEAPGEVFLSNGRTYKSYRGMGSLGAMGRGSADRYFQEDINDTEKFIPEGVEGRVPYRGPLEKIIEQLVGGVKASLGYTGNKNLDEFRKKAKFIKITSSGLNESHVHSISITRESPNYQTNK